MLRLVAKVLVSVQIDNPVQHLVSLGCFDPSCIEGVARIETRVGPGNVLTIQGSQFSEGGISDGDLVCSTGQVRGHNQVISLSELT